MEEVSEVLETVREEILERMHGEEVVAEVLKEVRVEVEVEMRQTGSWRRCTRRSCRAG